MTLPMALECFNVSVSSNLYMIKLISKCAAKTSLRSFYTKIMFGAIPEVMRLNQDEQLKNVIIA